MTEFSIAYGDKETWRPNGFYRETIGALALTAAHLGVEDRLYGEKRYDDINFLHGLSREDITESRIMAVFDADHDGVLEQSDLLRGNTEYQTLGTVLLARQSLYDLDRVLEKHGFDLDARLKKDVASNELNGFDLRGLAEGLAEPFTAYGASQDARFGVLQKTIWYTPLSETGSSYADLLWMSGGDFVSVLRRCGAFERFSGYYEKAKADSLAAERRAEYCRRHETRGCDEEYDPD